MKNLPLIRSPKAALIWSVILALPLIFLLSDPLLVLWSLFLILYLLPWGMCVACMTGGLIPMAVGAACGVASLYIAFGGFGALIGAALILIPAAAFIVISARQTPFSAAVRVMIFALLTGQAAALAVLRLSVPGGDILQAAGNAVRNAITGLGNAGDLTLNLLENFGMLTVPESLLDVAAGASLPLPDVLRNELLNQVEALVGNYLMLLLPTLLGGFNIYFGVGSVALSQHFGRKSRLKRDPGEAFPQIGMPMLQDWYVPKPWGMVFGLMGVGIFVEMLTRSAIPVLIGDLCYGVFTSVFTVQGIAVINDIQHKRGTGRGWRIALPLLLMMILPFVLILAGIMDQARDPRGLRRPYGGSAGAGRDTNDENDENDLI